MTKKYAGKLQTAFDGVIYVFFDTLSDSKERFDTFLRCFIYYDWFQIFMVK